MMVKRIYFADNILFGFSIALLLAVSVVDYFPNINFEIIKKRIRVNSLFRLYEKLNIEISKPILSLCKLF